MSKDDYKLGDNSRKHQKMSYANKLSDIFIGKKTRVRQGDRLYIFYVSAYYLGAAVEPHE